MGKDTNLRKIFSFFSTRAPAEIDFRKIKLLFAECESVATHPGKKPSALTCPLSLELFNEPVITPEGFIYEKSYLLEALSRDKKSRDPLSRNFLAPHDLKAFNEIMPYVNSFRVRRNTFLALYEEVITNARRCAHGNCKAEPALFVCPISQTIMSDPIIASNGIIYDKKSIENNEAFKKLDYIEFSELKEQINVFLYRKERLENTRSLSSILVESANCALDCNIM